jgi:lipopolysaccharide/colanic/teichoic acid biosynthesis glycosyltransferase
MTFSSLTRNKTQAVPAPSYPEKMDYIPSHNGKSTVPLPVNWSNDNQPQRTPELIPSQPETMDLSSLIGIPLIPPQVKWLEKFKPEKHLLNERGYLFAKRFLDLLVIFLTLPVFLPILVLCALLVKLESPGGPIFFVQKRTGQGGQRFGMYKFRTMVPNAEELKKELAHLNELQWPDFKITNDPRVTWMGRIMRKTSLDELPQIFNVIKGDMSLVGPRPTSFATDTYDLWHTVRLEVQPGITGLWQIIGRGATEFDTRVFLDIAYIDHRCLYLDIQILFRTALAVIEQRGRH